MLLPLACLHGRVAQCLTALLVLAEPPPRPRRGARAHGAPPPRAEAALPAKMAAELYAPASAAAAAAATATDIANSNAAAAAAAAGRKGRPSAPLPAPPPPAPAPPPPDNNNPESPNWQSFHPTLRERNALMFNNELMADVHFVVGPPGAARRVPAHKYVLAVGSSVFYAMFYGDLAEVKSEIHIPDVEPAAFLILLKYMYSDEIDLEADTVLATLYAAKKYIVPALAKACVNFLETSLEAKNACVLLSQSRLFEEPELTQRCWEVIDAQAEMALRSEGFCEIDWQTLEIIVTREALNAKEAVVFEAVLSWAEAECKRQGLPATPRNKRHVLGPALYLVRIPTMTLEEFANGAAQSDILTLEETHNIFLWYTAANKPLLEFPLTKRKGLAPQRCHRFQSSAYRSNQWRYRGRCDSIQFAVDRRVFVAGLGLYGSSSGKAEYSVKIELKRLGVVLAQNLTKFVSDGSSNTFSVWFEHPVQVEQDTFYTASAVLDGSELSYFGQEGMTEVQCGKVTFQFQCSSDSTNGTGVQGGQIPELIFYA
ncbi:BTB/POZ domain-containing protein 6 [Bubalus kerabau]|uniref:BTB/POZ domain-containing protein 6 n=1 Tax=Bubalus bubalis TaxID=89462 RepID=UPI001D12B883|nr:BTB/POZ domain-containing protein 6 [Bubalus bubalis]XP_055412886.1 BTB/POZ domain-containing protein 6 [Bubalus carabanensis]